MGGWWTKRWAGALFEQPEGQLREGAVDQHAEREVDHRKDRRRLEGDGVKFDVEHAELERRRRSGTMIRRQQTACSLRSSRWSRARSRGRPPWGGGRG